MFKISIIIFLDLVLNDYLITIEYVHRTQFKIIIIVHADINPFIPKFNMPSNNMSIIY